MPREPAVVVDKLWLPALPADLLVTALVLLILVSKMGRFIAAQYNHSHWSYLLEVTSFTDTMVHLLWMRGSCLDVWLVNKNN